MPYSFMSRLLSKMLAFGVLALLVVLLVAATLVDGIVGQGFAGRIPKTPSSPRWIHPPWWVNITDITAISIQAQP